MHRGEAIWSTRSSAHAWHGSSPAASLAVSGRGMALAVLRPPGASLVGRGAECERLDSLLADVRAGHSAVLLLSGEPGIGKTALLDYFAERAVDCRVVRTIGVESEMELPFAGLHQACATLLDGVERLPSPQRDALETAFGLSFGGDPDPFRVGLAVLSLLSDATASTPLVCLVDDAHWLDKASAQTLAFVARRLFAESVVMLFSATDSSEEFRGLPELAVHGLGAADARVLLSSVIRWPLDDQVRELIIAETHGNPLALLELPRDLSPAQLAGGFGFPDTGSLSGQIEESYLSRIEALPDEVRLLVLVTAADPTRDPALLWSAAQGMGLNLESPGYAQATELVEIGEVVRFRHPLVRSAVYRAATVSERQRVHAALAEATDPELDPDRRAWHRAQATLESSEDVAAELEQSAGRAQRRGGVAAAAAFLERAAALTPDPARRAQRSLAAGRASQLAGAPQAASELLEIAATGSLNQFDRAMLVRLRGQIALDLRRPRDAMPLLLDAATQLESIDAGLARETHLEALQAAIVAGRLGAGMLDTARAARAPLARIERAGAVDLLFEGLAARFADGYAASLPTLKHALRAAREEGDEPGQDVRWRLARRVAPDLFDDDTWYFFATRSVQMARDSGTLAVLPLALNDLAYMCCFEGNLDAAEALLEEADAIAAATGNEPIPLGRLSLVAFRGREEEASLWFDAAESAAIARNDGLVLTFIEHARAVLYNGLGHYQAALAASQSASARDELFVSLWSMPELVEAATRCASTNLAATVLERLSERTRAAGTELARGIEARSHALLSDGVRAEELYREAVDRLSRCRLKMELARARLLYGEWLRRENRRLESREQLRTALEMFTSMGAEGFAHRTFGELRAAGGEVRKRRVEARAELTAQELQIAQLARAGLSNPEIGARLFISPRTVEYHLHKVFAKVGVSSRHQLEGALASDSNTNSVH
jgi:DNA-binding CsgD family transcriptional regulator